MRRPTLRVYLPLRGKRNGLLNSKGEDDALAAVLRIVENRQWPADGYHFFFGVWAPPVRGGDGPAREIDLLIVDEQADLLHFVEIKGGSRLYAGQAWQTYDGRDPFDQVDGAAAQFIEGLGTYLGNKGVGGRLAYRRFVWGPSQMRDEIKALLPRQQARQFIGREHDPIRYIRKNVRLFPPPDGPLLAIGEHLDHIVAFIDANVSGRRDVLDGAMAVRQALFPERMEKQVSGGSPRSVLLRLHLRGRWIAWVGRAAQMGLLALGISAGLHLWGHLPLDTWFNSTPRAVDASPPPRRDAIQPVKVCPGVSVPSDLTRGFASSWR